MSHNPKYRGEFKDTHGIEWRIDLKNSVKQQTEKSKGSS